MRNQPCLKCGTSGFLWIASCPGCTARKIIYLRSPDRRTTVKFQKAVLKNLHSDVRQEVLELVAEMDRIFNEGENQ